MHNTVDDVMRYFKNSHVRKEKLQAIIEMSEEEHEYQQLVTYHKVWWLSLNDCVQRFTDLLPEIVRYFEQEEQNTANRPSECAKLPEFHNGIVDPQFQLYLYFLQSRLPILASINTQLQKSNQDLFTSYQKIASFKNAFLEPILNQVDDGMQDGNIRTDIDDIDFESSQFQQFKEQAISSGQLSNAQLHEVMKNIFNFTVTIGRSLESRFPEMDFVVHNMSFLCPTNRKHSRCDIKAVIQKYCKDSVNVTTAKMRYSVYRNDESLTHLFINCEQQPDTFFCKIADARA